MQAYVLSLYSLQKYANNYLAMGGVITKKFISKRFLLCKSFFSLIENRLKKRKHFPHTSKLWSKREGRKS